MASAKMDSPLMLFNGQPVCGKHGLVICAKCTVDYSDMGPSADGFPFVVHSVVATREAMRIDMPGGTQRVLFRPVLASEQGDDRCTKATGRVFPPTFTPPTRRSGREVQQPSPATLFPPAFNRCSIRALRFINTRNKQQVLLYTDGACLNNGQPNPRAGWAFVYGPDKATCDGRLENKGPFGGPVQPQTSNRAELRAVIAALRFRHWVGEGFTSMVIATDSEYIVIGATTWAKEWMRNGWRTAAGAVVKNRDLWEALLGEVERWDGEGLEVVFWRIGRELNSVADAAAKKVAKEGADADEFFTTHGIAC